MSHSSRKYNHRHRMLAGFLLLLYLALIILPLCLAFIPDIAPRPWRDEMASALAIAGLSLLFLEFTLSGRFKTLSAPIGMDIVMRFHQLMGRILIIFLLVHPFLYSLDYQSLPWDSDFSLSLRLEVYSGSAAFIAWILLGTLVSLAIMRQSLAWSYEHWRLSHLLMAIGVILFGAFHAWQSGRYTQLTDLQNFWIAGLLLVLATLLHVYFMLPIQQSLSPWRIKSIAPVAERTWRLCLQPEKKKLHYHAGQFAWLKFSRPFFSLQEHPFSISSFPEQDHLEFTIKEYGDFTSNLPRLPVGSRVYVDGPHGHFTLHHRHGDGIMLIAGGVGIAPVMSILRELADKNDPRPVILISCYKTENEICYAAELEQLKTKLNLQVIQLLSCPSESWQGACGLISTAVLDEALPENRKQWLYFICGPSPMMDCAEHALMELSVPLKQIITERFKYDAQSNSPRNRLILYLAVFVSLIILTSSALLAN